jgi:hypothetical protein
MCERTSPVRWLNTIYSVYTVYVQWNDFFQCGIIRNFFFTCQQYRVETKRDFSFARKVENRRNFVLRKFAFRKSFRTKFRKRILKIQIGKFLFQTLSAVHIRYASFNKSVTSFEPEIKLILARIISQLYNCFRFNQHFYGTSICGFISQLWHNTPARGMKISLGI